MPEDDEKKTPRFNTVVGKVDPNVMKRSLSGHGNTVVGPTDSLGNTRFDKGTTIGYRAKGGEDSVVIGAEAGSAGAARQETILASADQDSFINLDGAKANGFDRMFVATNRSGISAVGAQLDHGKPKSSWFEDYFIQIAAGVTVIVVGGVGSLIWKFLLA